MISGKIVLQNYDYIKIVNENFVFFNNCLLLSPLFLLTT